jgi:hypothetical protein
MAQVFGVAGPLIRLALGTSKYAKAEFSLQPLDSVVAALKQLPADISNKYQARALRKAAKPGKEALRNQVSQLGQVTGNLLASVTDVTRKYTNNRQRLPVTVVVVGFRRPTNAPSQKMATPAFAGGSVLKGPNRAYHSHLVEYGTQRRTPGKTRRTKRRRVVLGGRIRTIAESVKDRPANPRGILSSGFGLNSKPEQKKGKRRAFVGGGQYPIDFIATGSVGPSPARRPLAKALAASRSQMQNVLDAQMKNALAQAIRAYRKKFNDLGDFTP